MNLLSISELISRQNIKDEIGDSETSVMSNKD